MLPFGGEDVEQNSEIPRRETRQEGGGRPMGHWERPSIHSTGATERDIEGSRRTPRAGSRESQDTRFRETRLIDRLVRECQDLARSSRHSVCNRSLRPWSLRIMFSCWVRSRILEFARTSWNPLSFVELNSDPDFQRRDDRADNRRCYPDANRTRPGGPPLKALHANARTCKDAATLAGHIANASRVLRGYIRAALPPPCS